MEFLHFSSSFSLSCGDIWYILCPPAGEEMDVCLVYSAGGWGRSYPPCAWPTHTHTYTHTLGRSVGGFSQLWTTTRDKTSTWKGSNFKFWFVGLWSRVTLSFSCKFRAILTCVFHMIGRAWKYEVVRKKSERTEQCVSDPGGVTKSFVFQKLDCFIVMCVSCIL